MTASTKLIPAIRLLVAGKKKVNELSQFLQISERQVHRILTQIENLGYLLEQDLDKRYFIFGTNQLNLKQFSPEEQSFMIETIQYFKPNHPLAEPVLRKLNNEEYPLPLAEHIAELTRGNNYAQICWAIEKECLIWLKPYHSNGTKPESNRLVLPLQLQPIHRQLLAYEKSTRKCKTFKLDRIGLVEITNERLGRTISIKEKPDPFGFYAEKPEVIKLQLSDAAARLMQEEFVASRQYIQKKENVYQYVGPMASPIGVGRFILGLPGQIQILKGNSLREHLIKSLNAFDF